MTIIKKKKAELIHLKADQERLLAEKEFFDAHPSIVQTSEIQERLKKIIPQSEIARYEDRLNGIYETILKPYNFKWLKTQDAPGGWDLTSYNLGQIEDNYYSKVGTPVVLTRRNFFDNMLDLPFNETVTSGTGYLQRIYIADSTGFQIVGATDETHCYFNNIDISFKEVRAGVSYDVRLFSNQNTITKIAPKSGLYINSIYTDSVSIAEFNEFNPNDPDDNGFFFNIKLNFVSIYDDLNYSYRNKVFKFGGKELRNFYNWVPEIG
jgi:hypothetical protein